MMRRRAPTHAGFFTPHLRPGICLLDCGCGPGTISLDLAKVVSPGTFFGIDRELSQVRLAQSLAGENDLEAWFPVASIYALPFPDHQFDAAFAHALFQHLREPVKALLEISRVLKPTGMVGIRSPDWGGSLIYPTTPRVEEAIRIFKEIQISNGGDVYVGRKQKRLLRQAGFAKISISASYECHQDTASIGEFIAHCLDVYRSAQLKRGGEEVDRLVEELKGWGQNRDAFFAQAWCEAVAWLN